MIVRLLGAEQADLKGLERGQIGLEGFGNEGIERLGAKPWSSPRRLAAAFWQTNELSLVKFKQQSAGSRVFELAIRIAPLP